MSKINNLATTDHAQARALIAQLEGLLGNSGAGDPPSNPRRPKKKNPRTIKYLTEEELTALFAAIAAEAKVDGTRADPVRDLAIFEVAFHRGLRASEVGMIGMDNVDLKRRRIFVARLKSGDSHEHFMTKREVKALTAWLSKRGPAAGPVFLSRNGMPISRQRLDELMRHYGERANLPAHKRHFHCLRHTCATSLRERNIPMEDIQDHLGHTNPASTAIYAKMTSPKRLRKDELLASTW
jgi:type 1 fimbriae regulatory protein FimB